jgi:hypothetical protein
MSSVRAPRPRPGEGGVALVAAIIVMVLVVAVIGIFSMLAVDGTQRGRADRQRAESLYWVETAAADILSQLRSHQIGPHAQAGTVSGMQLWRVPGATGRRALSVTMPDGTQNKGFYEVLAPVRGAPVNTVGFVRDPANVDERGEVVLVLRGSTSATDTRPRAVRVVFRRSSLARYAVVSDAPIDAGNLGSSRLTGSIHSNNVENASVGVRLSGTNTSGAKTVSSTTGSIQGTCSAKSCIANSQKAVSFTNIDRAFAEIERLHARGGCTLKIACVVNDTVNWQPAGTSPAYRVRLNGSGGCVLVDHIAYPLRVDAGHSSIVDDRRAPVGPFGTSRSYCPSTGGIALLFNTDVQVQGSRGGPPVTIMARNTSFPRTVVNGGTTTRQQPASIFLVQTGSVLGSSEAVGPNALDPVGLIAEGSVYLPDWAIASGANGNLQLRHVAIAAKEGELSLGPMTMAMAGSLDGLSAGGASPTEGGGLNPCASEASTFDRGARLNIVGAVASRREPVLGYGTSTSCSFGFSNRTYAYSDNLEWNPPPLYPTTSPWHVAEWDELAVEQ